MTEFTRPVYRMPDSIEVVTVPITWLTHMTDRLSNDPTPEFSRDQTVQDAIRSKALELKAFIEQMGPSHQEAARAIIGSVFAATIIGNPRWDIS